MYGSNLIFLVVLVASVLGVSRATKNLIEID